ncbi:sigma 54-interacting transcriptional regulator [Nitrosococcus watsonii]|uniref:Sigma 54 interacting domain protein n=1 Tax=Nitrosococcus watsoni (strain C-113) TaxID=105559 RepID=D8K9K7_NITWC|nr:sigma 54-interacting transcriptional regulator [Nitrosococcus watsonii]ADJ27296.1 Sigma 54 interacting domain protein [Nitrosococcus watsonii C-113]
MAWDMSVWVHSLAQNDNQIPTALVEALMQAGIRSRTLNLEAPKGTGVLFFKKFTPQLCELLSKVSHRGQEQVLAIAVSPIAMADSHAWRLLRAGAADVFCWQHSTEPLTQIISRLRRWAAVDQILESPLVQKNLLGRSLAWRSVLRQVIEAAHFTDASVLLMGETGTGKELIARLIHTLNPREKKKELVVLDCGTIVPELAGSEFFGHERGAFTGAISPRDGAFALASEGTLFLDEIGELPLGLQVQLLRVIQERTYKRVGGSSWQHTDFRLVCATNKDLAQAVEQGKFRSDLYYRIAAWVCRLPPLRERKEDILPLTHHFLNELRPDKAPIELDEPVRQHLLRRNYPGNIRELKQLAVLLGSRHVGPGPITLGALPQDERPTEESEQGDWYDVHFEQAIHHALDLGVGLKEISRIATETAIRVALRDEEGNLQRAARKLCITDRALQLRRANHRLTPDSLVSGQKISPP